LDASKLLEQFLGGEAVAGTAGGIGRGVAEKAGGFGGGMVAGGLLGVLLGNKKARKMAGGVVGYGAAAAVGALAFKAYQNWQAGKNAVGAPPPTPAEMAVEPPAAFQPDRTAAADGAPFQLSLVSAMIGAAKADGHVDAAEQKRLFEHVERLGLDAESKGFIFEAFGKDIGVDDVAAAAATQEQAAELYLASRLAIDPDHAAERIYLEALARRLKLPADLVEHLNRQVEAQAEA